MAVNYGKKFEEKFKQDWLKVADDLYRLPDQMNGYKTTSRNICDFIGYKYPNLYYLECKSVSKGNTFSIEKLTQYENMCKKVGIRGVRIGVVIWYIEKQRVIYVPISTITQMRKDGKKSVNLKEIDNYDVIEIPSELRRTFLDSDYSVLFNLKEGE